MRIIRFICLIIVVYPIGSLSQTENRAIDSLIRVAEKMGDSLQENAINLSLDIYSLSKKSKYQEGQLISRLIAARNSYDLGKYDNVILYAAEAKKIAKNIGDAESEAEAGQLLGMGYGELGFFKRGRTELKRALDIANRITDADSKFFRRGFIFSALAANIDRANGDLDSIAGYHRNAISEFENITLDKSYRKPLRSMAYSNIGETLIRQEEYNEAKSILLIADSLSVNGSQHIRTNALVQLGRVHIELEEFDQAANRFKEAKSLATSLHNPYLLKEIFKGTSEVFLNLKIPDSAQYYSEKYIRLNDSLAVVEKKAIRTPIDQIIDEKDSQFDLLKRNLNLVIALLSVLILLAIVLYARQALNNRKKYRDLIARIEYLNKQDNTATVRKTVGATQVSKSTQDDILTKLEKFESQKGFLNANLSLAQLAHKMNTNTKYLSTTIKEQKGKNYNNYINGLRVDYIVSKLYNENRFREYSVEGLAEEAGFSSREVFSKIFKKETGLTPFQFITQIKKDSMD